MQPVSMVAEAVYGVGAWWRGLRVWSPHPRNGVQYAVEAVRRYEVGSTRVSDWGVNR